MGEEKSNVVITEEGALSVKKLTFWEAAMIIVGANIGAGILGLAYSSRKAGWPILLMWLIIAGVFTTVSMLYVAETTLRTKKPMQLPGLAERYVGKLGAVLVFISVCANSIGCMISYTSGSGEILAELLGISPTLGSLIFTVPAVVVVWLGLKATGLAEKFISTGMIVLLAVIIGVSFLSGKADISQAIYTNWTYAVPVFNVAIFCYIAQYAVPELARGLRHNARALPKAVTIGMLITASTNPFYSELVRGVERSCFERGYSLVLCNTEGDEQRMNRNLETLMQKRVDGLLLLCTETHQPSPEIMQRYPSVPTVMMDWAPFDGDSDLIQDNSLLGGDMATQYLIDQGHSRIACIAGPLDKTPARLRLEGYHAAMARCGLPVAEGYVVTSDFEFGGGFSAMQQLLALPQRPQAVFVGNDAMAVGAYQALYQAGLQIPQDMALVGYDDIELARYMTPPLTTIHQPKDELGELAIDVLIHRMADPQQKQQRVQLTPELVVRGSA